MLNGYLARAWQSTQRQAPWATGVGLARTLLAIATIGTLVSSPTTALFRPAVNDPEFPRCAGSAHSSLFCTLGGTMEVRKWIAIALLMLVASGWRPRITGVLHAWVCWSIRASALLVDGGDQLASNLTLLLLPWTLTDGRKWHWMPVAHPSSDSCLDASLRAIAVVSIVVTKIQVSAVYLDASLGKIFVPEWADGTAVYYWFNHPTFGAPSWLRWIVEPIVRNGLGVAAISWGTIVLEFLLAIALLLSRRRQKKLFIAGLALHAAIWAMHGLGSFSMTMFAALTIYIGPREFDLRGIWRRWYVTGKPGRPVRGFSGRTDRPAPESRDLDPAHAARPHS